MESLSRSGRGPTLAVACGGTGGHFYPGVTVAQAFADSGGRAVLLIGGHHREEQLGAAADYGLPAVPITVARRPDRRWQYPLMLARMAACVQESRGILRREAADAVLCMGSFACLPPGLAAASLRLPLFLHEANCLIGRANALLGRWADVLALNQPLRPPHATRARQELVGMPLRQALVRAAAAPADGEVRAAWRTELALAPDRPTLLVFGGSQGAEAINGRLPAAVAGIPNAAARLQVIHLTGATDNAAVEAGYRNAGVTAHVATRSKQMERLYQVADLAVCRAGAATVAELALFGLPAILIPLPTAADDHQTVNAHSLADAGAGLLLPEQGATPAALAARLDGLLSESSRRADMAVAARRIAYADAAEHLCRLIRDRIGRSPEPHTKGNPR